MKQCAQGHMEDNGRARTRILVFELVVQCSFCFGHIQSPGTTCLEFCKLEQYSRILPLMDFNDQYIEVRGTC